MSLDWRVGEKPQEKTEAACLTVSPLISPLAFLCTWSIRIENPVLISFAGIFKQVRKKDVIERKKSHLNKKGARGHLVSAIHIKSYFSWTVGLMFKKMCQKSTPNLCTVKYPKCFFLSLQICSFPICDSWVHLTPARPWAWLSFRQGNVQSLLEHFSLMASPQDRRSFGNCENIFDSFHSN